jgi:hypothetical protein
VALDEGLRLALGVVDGDRAVGADFQPDDVALRDRVAVLELEGTAALAVLLGARAGRAREEVARREFGDESVLGSADDDPPVACAAAASETKRMPANPSANCGASEEPRPKIVPCPSCTSSLYACLYSPAGRSSVSPLAFRVKSRSPSPNLYV